MIGLRCSSLLIFITAVMEYDPSAFLFMSLHLSLDIASSQVWASTVVCARTAGAEPIAKALGGNGWDTWEDPPAKPKSMRWQTYEQKYERWERVVEKANEEFAIRAARLLKWI
jgi:hypothetical protein